MFQYGKKKMKGVVTMSKRRQHLWAAILCAALFLLTAGAGVLSCRPAGAEEQHTAYLAVYVASYEYNMGVEHAQFPSGTYTDTCRTDVLYYGISTDGVNFEGLNNNKAVYYPKGCYQLGAPSIFRKPDGSYGLVASVNQSNNQIFICDSEDLIFFENERILTLGSKGSVITNPMVEYDETDAQYYIYWEGGDGQSYMASTDDFSSFSDPQQADYKKETVTANLPSYAEKEEAAIFELTEEEYERIQKKYGTVKSVAVHRPQDQVITEGERIELPDQVEVAYSDGSTARMGVDWDISGLDLASPKKGSYTVRGTIKNSTYHSPLAQFRADPFVAYNEQDGMYYLTGSNLNEKSASGGGAYNTIVLRRSDSINGLTDAKEADIWKNKTIQVTDERKDVITGWYWAPELHFIGGKWRILAMGTVKSTVNGVIQNDGWAQCVFSCEGDDLMDPDNWNYEGYIGETTDGKKVGAFDTTFFEYGGQCYYVTPREDKIFITTVDADDLTTPTGPRVPIAVPDRAFEKNLGSGQNIEEGPGVLIHDEKIFVTYSCSTVDMHYGVCLVYADLKDDLMDSESWHKYQAPLLTTADLTTTVKEGTFTKDTTENGEYKGIFGPGHNSFTTDENGNPVIVFHARNWDDSYPGATGDNKYGLTDPGRHAYVNSVHFGADGFPIFNMTPGQILSDDLKTVSVTIQVKSPSESPSPAPSAAAIPQQNVPQMQTAQPDMPANPIKGTLYTVGKNQYKILNAQNKTAAFSGPKNKKTTLVVIPSRVKIMGVEYSVTEISKKACAGCKKLKKITVKSKTVKKVGSQAFKGISGKAKIIVPKDKWKRYQKLFRGKGQKRTVKLKKSGGA